MDKFKESLLLEKNEETEENGMLNEFMKLYGGDVPTAEPSEPKNYKVVEPCAEFCIKTRAENGDKIFLNICTADHIPSPKEITDQELVQLLESEDPSRFRVPMSLGEPHAEIDKSGKGCTAYDIIISQSFCEKIKTNDLFMGFFMSVIMEGINNKYDITLHREWVKLKHKKSMGKILAQHVRTESKPWIMEMDPSTVHSEKDSLSSR